MAKNMRTAQFRFRSRFLPSSLQDWGLFIITLVLMPTIYVYEMCIVLPYITNGYAPVYFGILVLGVFAILNIVGNLVGLVVTDTSVPLEVMSVERADDKWEFCSDCLSYVPPRAWHCKLCKVCILKRDHHCTFSGSCVGHFNHRYFVMFLIFVNIGTLYCIVSESLFMYSKIEFLVLSSFIKLTLPLFAVMLGLETFQNEMCILMYVIIWIIFIFTCVLLNFHLRIILRGQVTHDVAQENFDFDLGKIENIKQVLGERWYIAWAFPLINSAPPGDGIKWKTVHELKLESCKEK